MTVLHPQSTGPDGLARLEQAWAKPRWFSLVTEVNNTHIGVIYIATGFLFFIGAGILALLMRIQLAVPGNDFLGHAIYNQFFTMHGSVMMFLFAVPIVEAFAVLLLPSMIGSRDMPFPRLSAFGYWCYAIGGTLVFSSLFFRVAPDGGWFMYPPLTGPVFSPGINTEIWILGLAFVEIAAIAAAVEIIVGVLKTRAPGMTLSKVPIFAWYMLVTAGMIALAMPAVIVADVLLELERGLNMPFFDPSRGGDPLLWQHLFWLFGHPEVYIIFLPAAGMVSMMLPSFARVPLVGYGLVVMAAIAVGILSFGLWVHHMYATGLPRMSLAFFAVASTAISIPMGIQVFAWIATLWEGKPQLRVPMLFILGFIFTFTVGGLTGVMVATVPYDWQVHDTYFVVAHFHYVLIGGMVFPLFAAFYYWTPLVSGRLMFERLGQWAFWLMFVGFNGTFFPMHLTGLRGMPRRVYTFAGDLGLNWLNLISSVFAFVFALGVLVFVVDMVWHFRRGAKRPENPWGAPSLEWVSGQASMGFRSIMPIDTRYPWWSHPDLRTQMWEGRGFLPDSPVLARESLLTAPLSAAPEQILRLPGPSWIPFIGAIGTAACFAGVAIKHTAVALTGGMIGLVAILLWLWTMDAPMPRERADAGRGLALPLYRNDSASVGWWGLMVTLVVDGAVLASLIFTYFFLWTARPMPWPPDGSSLPGAVWPAAMIALTLAAWIACEVAARLNRTDRGLATGLALVLCAALALGAGWLMTLWPGHLAIVPTTHAYGASFWTLVGYAAIHAGLGAFAALWCCLRLALGMVDSWRSLTLHLAVLWWRFTGPSVALLIVILAGFPHVV
jgi:cytochrome c oxidase subunit I+III